MPIILYIATSIDMMIAREDGSVDWLDIVDKEGEDYGYKEFYNNIDIVAMGRKTFEEGFKLSGNKHPYPDKPTVVFSQTNPKLEGVTITSNLIKYLVENNKERIWIVGGGQIISEVMKHDLVDEMLIFVVPMVLGGGIQMFLPNDTERRYKVEEVKKYDTGLVLLHYTRF